MRERPAPNAVRTATSFSREAARASSRLATLAQAISSTKATAPSRTSSAGRTLPTNCSRSGTTSALHPVWYCGTSCARRAAMVVISAWACSKETPGFRRATVERKRPIVAEPSVGMSSTLQISAGLPVLDRFRMCHSNRAGMTPTTV